MIHIRTWSEAEHALDHLPALCLRSPLQAHLDRLREFDGYDLPELAEFLVMAENDTLAAIEDTLGRTLVDRQIFRFSDSPEFAVSHPGWVEVVWIISDDGYGFVLFVPMTSRKAPELVNACQTAVRETEGPASL